MSLFPTFTSEFHPLFRLLNDYDRATRQAFRDIPETDSLRSFSPKFDVREHKESYELQGELPGIEQKDITIEWTDSNTLSISGRTEHRSERGTKPQGFIEEGEASSASHEYHKPTVEDEAAGGDKTVAKTGEKGVVKHDDNEPRYWVTERSVGEFHRSFSFPARVDQDAVKASLKNGILNILVPKAQAPRPRKIAIQ
ncbi:HSP20-like chaperone [Lepidopterella palustris CBS 459.81]|uniref:HSP20-like chaperone n=1 Tax=Lepidopterella palustris CBS 459.81 TaxID=1314670 RepID=A0A8E2EF36_9PEZI|nr:HSP20-like chaperone [Lepidopterella palustris CBS 459.81]